MSDPVIRTCSGTSWACAICACATCCACAASTFVNVSNDAEPIRVASLVVVGFTMTPRCQNWHGLVETKIFRTSRYSEAGSLSLSPVFQFLGDDRLCAIAPLRNNCPGLPRSLWIHV